MEVPPAGGGPGGGPPSPPRALYWAECPMRSSTLRALTHLPRRMLTLAAAAPLPAAPGPPGRLHQLIAAVPGLALLIAMSGGFAAFGGYLVDMRVNKEVSAVVAQTAALSARLDGITKEVDAKTAGLAKEVDAKTAGLSKEVDAKVAGVIENAGIRAEAETLRVFKEERVPPPPPPRGMSEDAASPPTPIVACPLPPLPPPHPCQISVAGGEASK